MKIKGVKFIVAVVMIIISLEVIVSIGEDSIGETKFQIPCYEIFLGNGGSMFPTIKEGVFVKVDKCYSIGDLKVGDIISFINIDGSPTAHRVIDLDFKSRLIQTRGDNNKGADSKVGFENYRGKIITVLI